MIGCCHCRLEELFRQESVSEFVPWGNGSIGDQSCGSAIGRQCETRYPVCPPVVAGSISLPFVLSARTTGAIPCSGAKKMANNTNAKRLLVAMLKMCFFFNKLESIALLEPCGRLLVDYGELALQRGAVLLRGGEVGRREYLPLRLGCAVGARDCIDVALRRGVERLAL